jgi:hypothetical protein
VVYCNQEAMKKIKAKDLSIGDIIKRNKNKWKVVGMEPMIEGVCRFKLENKKIVGNWSVMSHSEVVRL